MDNRPIIFDAREAVLKQKLAPELQRGYREAIVKFRYWLRQTGKTPDVEALPTMTPPQLASVKEKKELHGWGLRTHKKGCFV